MLERLFKNIIMKESWKYIFGDLSEIYKIIDKKREEYSKSNLQIFPSNDYIFRCLHYFDINENLHLFQFQHNLHKVQHNHP